MRKEIEDRLIKLALAINALCKTLDNSFLSQHLTIQIIRSSTSLALNYGEAQAAESKNDFIHKTSIVLKELRETQINLRLLETSTQQNEQKMNSCKDECAQLVAIFHKTVISVKRNKHKSPSLEN
ncbi:MAG: four helix bundle protein [Bacteroidota bacterium]|nr:four helix bundle protein [Bacteroidota bacterium]